MKRHKRPWSRRGVTFSELAMVIALVGVIIVSSIGWRRDVSSSPIRKPADKPSAPSAQPDPDKPAPLHLAKDSAVDRGEWLSPPSH